MHRPERCGFSINIPGIDNDTPDCCIGVLPEKPLYICRLTEAENPFDDKGFVVFGVKFLRVDIPEEVR